MWLFWIRSDVVYRACLLCGVLELSSLIAVMRTHFDMSAMCWVRPVQYLFNKWSEFRKMSHSKHGMIVCVPARMTLPWLLEGACEGI